MTKVLITGASGYVGKEFIEQVDGLDITSIDRVIVDIVRFKSSVCIHADLNDLSANQKELLRDFEGIVVHLAAARSDEETADVYERDNIKATNELLKALDAQKICKFIHVGSVAAIDGEYLDKEGLVPSNSDDWYRLTKYRQQKIISEWSRRYGIPLTILAPSAIYDANAGANSTNIGRLEKVVSKLKLAPSINVLKSLTAMELLIQAITDSVFVVGKLQHEKYLVIDRPTKTVTEICRDKFNARVVIKVPLLKNALLSIAFILLYFGLSKRIPLTKERVLKLYKSTDYRADKDYKDWANE